MTIVATQENLETENAVVNVRKTLEVFHHPGEVVEIRIIGIPGRGRPYTASGYFEDFGAAARLAVQWERTAKPAGIYFTFNEIDPMLIARSPERITKFLEATTSDRDIVRRRWLLIDVDPVRPKGIASTDQQLQIAHETAEQVREWLASEMLWPEPVEAMSGNGFHLLYPLDLPNDDASKMLIQSILNTLHTKFSSAEISIDRSVFNAARITKFYGTVARKGVLSPSRNPHRRSKLTYVPDYLLQSGGDDVA